MNERERFIRVVAAQCSAKQCTKATHPLISSNAFVSVVSCRSVCAILVNFLAASGAVPCVNPSPQLHRHAVSLMTISISAQDKTRIHTAIQPGLSRRHMTTTHAPTHAPKETTSATPVVEPITASAMPPDTTAAADASSSSSPASDSQPPQPPVPPPRMLRMPEIEGVNNCTLLRWCVEVGSPYNDGDVLCEIDSDLAVIEYKAHESGILASHATPTGGKILEGQVLALAVDDEEQMKYVKEWKRYQRLKEQEQEKAAEEEARKEREEDAESNNKEQEKQ